MHHVNGAECDLIGIDGACATFARRRDRGTQVTVKCRYAPGERLCLLASWAVSSEFDELKPTELPARVTESRRIWHVGLSTPKPAWAGKSRPPRSLPNLLRALAPQLKIEAVRVERLQAITEADARAEGVVSDGSRGDRVRPTQSYQAV